MKPCTGFQFSYLYMTSTHCGGQGQGGVQFDNVYLRNDDIYIYIYIHEMPYNFHHRKSCMGFFVQQVYSWTWSIINVEVVHSSTGNVFEMMKDRKNVNCVIEWDIIFHTSIGICALDTGPFMRSKFKDIHVSTVFFLLTLELFYVLFNVWSITKFVTPQANI